MTGDTTQTEDTVTAHDEVGAAAQATATGDTAAPADPVEAERTGAREDDDPRS